MTRVDRDTRTSAHPHPRRIGPFVAGRTLGEGAFGCVYLAREGRSRRVAIKVPKVRQGPEGRAIRERFLEEARKAAGLDHPGIVKILQVGETRENPPLPDGTPYIVMPYMEGGSLAGWLAEKAPPWWGVAAIVAAVARAVDFAHNAGLIHRDLKPENVLLDGDDRPYVADFGIAVSKEVLGSVQEGFGGTLAYMSPEQLDGEPIDNRTDIWSLGILLYAMLTRRLPFSGPDCLARILCDRPEPPRQLDGGIPEGLEEICLKCLEKPVERRYTTARDLADALGRFSRPILRIVNGYNLLDGNIGLIGRERDLGRFTSWASTPGDNGADPLLIVTDCGGAGKSAAAWSWFSEVAPKLDVPFWGCLWFSFERLGATFTRFVGDALKYATGEDAPGIDADPLELARASETLVGILRDAPYLVVLDGFELLLNRYAGFQPVRPSPEGPLPPDSSAPVEQRSSSDLFANATARGFFKDLAMSPCRSRILITSRIFPGDLKTASGEVNRGCRHLEAFPFAEEDALRLWRELGCSGQDEDLLPIFRSFGCHPLWIQIFARRVKNSLNPPGDFEAWCAAHDPSRLPGGDGLGRPDHRGLEFALAGLDPPMLRTIRILSRLRRLDDPDTFEALFVRADDHCDRARHFASVDELERGLEELRSRGLLGRNRETGAFGMHPLVRDEVFQLTDAANKEAIREALCDHYDRRIKARGAEPAATLNDLAYAIDLYWLQTELGQYREAFEIFEDPLDFDLYYRFCEGRLRHELITKLAPMTPRGKPLLAEQIDHIKVLFMLAKAEMFDGNLRRAIDFFEAAEEQIDESEKAGDAAGPPRSWGLEPGGVKLKIRKPTEMRAIVYSEASHAYRLSGHLRRACRAAEDALVLVARNRSWSIPLKLTLMAFGRYRLGLVLSAMGRTDDARRMFQGVVFLRAWKLASHFIPRSANLVGFLYACLSRQEAWMGRGAEALRWADEARRFFEKDPRIINLMHADRLRGAAYLLLDRLDDAEGDLDNALKKAVASDRIEEILLTRVQLADLYRRRSRWEDARRMLAGTCDDKSCEYRTTRADAFNVLARIERDHGNLDRARQAADRACQLALCDGEEFSYKWGVEGARELLRSLPEREDGL